MTPIWTPALEAELRYLIRREYARQQRVDAACSGKNGFQTPNHARESMPRRTMHGRVTVYHCQVCHLWHVGSHLSSKRRDRRPASTDFSEETFIRRSA